MDPNNEKLVIKARDGDKNALEALVKSIQNRIYGLSIRMLYNPADAEDATQEILIKIITNLGCFRLESAFTTWVYRIACNHLLTTRKRRAERQNLSFQSCEERIVKSTSLTEGLPETNVEEKVLVKEMKIRCMQMLLLCLDRKHRIAYVLGEVVGVSGEEGAAILQISPAAYRKKFSRARKQLREAMSKNCGLVKGTNPCKCERQAYKAIQSRKLDPDKLMFADHPAQEPGDTELSGQEKDLDDFKRIANLYRSHPTYIVSDSVLKKIQNIVNPVT
ncbi:MAG TPA: RNA polymerase sigma factor [Myxococcota bacterium]|nr:RNA polymerase sigma factor [Myxococcota bacterium]